MTGYPAMKANRGWVYQEFVVTVPTEAEPLARFESESEAARFAAKHPSAKIRARYHPVTANWKGHPLDYAAATLLDHYRLAFSTREEAEEWLSENGEWFNEQYSPPDSKLPSHLRFDLLALSKGELTPSERLYVIQNAKHLAEIHQGYLFDLYVACGCFDAALQITSKRSLRFLGDLAWAAGDFGKARQYYAREGEDRSGPVYRLGTHWDRLIKLEFCVGQWESAVRAFVEAPFESVALETGKAVILTDFEISARPYMQIAAIAACKCTPQVRQAVVEKLIRIFEMTATDIEQLFASASAISSERLQSFQRRFRPRLVGQEPRSLEEAVKRGETASAQSVLDCVLRAEEISETAARRLNEFLTSGSDAPLREFVTLLTRSGVGSVSESMLGDAISRSDFGELGWADLTRIEERVSSDLLIRLYESHPVMYRRYLDRLIALKLRHNTLPTGCEMVEGVLRYNSMAASSYWANSLKTALGEYYAGIPLDYTKIISARDWAEIRCSDWVSNEGGGLIAELMISETDASLLTRKVSAQCAKWLAARWDEEVGGERWKSEARLFQIVRDAFKGATVVRQARPLWLAPQHLDIYLPELYLAIEYMGEQHYEPVELFGGATGLERTRQRDTRKAQVCNACGIHLVTVRYDENLKEAVKRLKAQFL